MTKHINNYRFEKPRMISEDEFNYLKIKAHPIFENVDSPFIAVLKKFHIEFVFIVIIMIAMFPLFILVYIANGLEDMEMMKYFKASDEKYKYYRDLEFKINRSRIYNDFISMTRIS